MDTSCPNGTEALAVCAFADSKKFRGSDDGLLRQTDSGIAYHEILRCIRAQLKYSRST